MSEAVQFANIFLGGKNDFGEAGVLKMSEPGVGWKTKSGKAVTVRPVDMKGCTWICLGSLYQLCFSVKGGGSVKFVGFKETDFDRIDKFVTKVWKLSLDEITPSTKGWNWGDIAVNGQTLEFDVDGQLAFEMPLTDVNQCSVSARHDVALEFHRSAGGRQASECDSLVELRFHVPEENTTFTPTGEENDTEKITPGVLFRNIVLKHADVDDQTGTGWVSLPRMMFMVPRGRFDVELFATYMKVHAKSPWKIPYDNITRLSKLPRDERNYYFVISLSPPVRQGHVTYPHLVMSFQGEEHMELELSMTDEALAKHPTLSPIMSGHSHKVIARVIKSLSGKKLFGAGTFKSKYGQSSVRCSMKANEGQLYPMEKSFFFMHKPPTYLRYDSIAHVEFARMDAGSSSMSSRNFDITVTMKKNQKQVVFNNIPKQEYSSLFNFAMDKQMDIRGGRARTSDGRGGMMELSSDEEEAEEVSADEDFKAVSESESDDDFSEEEGEDMVGDDDLSAEELSAEDDDDEEEDDEDEDVVAVAPSPAKKKSKRPRSDSSSSKGGEVAKSSKSSSSSKASSSSHSSKSSSKGKAKASSSKSKKNDKKKSNVKRARSAYIFFMGKRRPEVKAANPALSFGELTQQIGAEWKQLSDHEKAEFNQMAAEDKSRYQRELKEEQAAQQ